jgi:hypothetical protein
MRPGDQAVTAPVDVLAVLRRVSRYVPNEDFVEFDDALHAVAELIEASHEYFTGYCVDEADDDCATGSGFDTGCTLEQHEAAKRLRAALARVGGA